MINGLGKDFLRLSKTAAGVKRALDLGAIPRLFFDLVVITVVDEERIVGFFVHQQRFVPADSQERCGPNRYPAGRSRAEDTARRATAPPTQHSRPP